MSTFSPVALSLALSITIVPCALAGEDSVADDPTVIAQSGEPWLTPTLDFRLRYEFREADPFDPSHAATARARLGLLTREVGGFSVFGELEVTEALIDDYRSNPADGSTSPHVPNNTVIADPENFELNQAWLRYSGNGFTGTIGRQHLVRNNGAFLGDTIWRQNLQTFDAINLEYDSGEWWFGYVYSDRVLRTFGDDANDAPPGPPLRDLEGDLHFFDVRYKKDDLTISGYLNHIDIDNSTAAGETTSIGGIVERAPYRAELAFQDGTSSLASGNGDYQAWYAHLSLSQSMGDTQLIAGAEYLGEYFRFPVGRLHAFNGFADAFVVERSGFNNAGGAFEGLSDLYIGAVRPGLPWGLTAKGFFHCFLDDSFSKTYGYEIDAALEKKISEDMSVLLTGALFFAEKGNGFNDIQQVTLGMDFKY